jgi:hypothetical protein
MIKLLNNKLRYNRQTLNGFDGQASPLAEEIGFHALEPGDSKYPRLPFDLKVRVFWAGFRAMLASCLL